MTSTDYLIDIALLALVLLQIRARPMNLRTLALPLIGVAAAASHYLKAVPTTGHDVILYIALGALGAVIGIACALTTRVWHDHDGTAWTQAGVTAAALWILGIGTRLAFSEYTTHGGGPTVTRFSITHHITGGDAWTAALVLMAVAEVTARLITLRLRAHVGRTTDNPSVTGPTASPRTSVAA